MRKIVTVLLLFISVASAGECTFDAAACEYVQPQNTTCWDCTEGLFLPDDNTTVIFHQLNKTVFLQTELPNTKITLLDCSSRLVFLNSSSLKLVFVRNSTLSISTAHVPSATFIADGDAAVLTASETVLKNCLFQGAWQLICRSEGCTLEDVTADHLRLWEDWRINNITANSITSLGSVRPFQTRVHWNVTELHLSRLSVYSLRHIVLSPTTNITISGDIHVENSIASTIRNPEFSPLSGLRGSFPPNITISDDRCTWGYWNATWGNTMSLRYTPYIRLDRSYFSSEGYVYVRRSVNIVLVSDKCASWDRSVTVTDDFGVRDATLTNSFLGTYGSIVFGARNWETKCSESDLTVTFYRAGARDIVREFRLSLDVSDIDIYPWTTFYNQTQLSMSMENSTNLRLRWPTNESIIPPLCGYEPVGFRILNPLKTEGESEYTYVNITEGVVSVPTLPASTCTGIPRPRVSVIYQKGDRLVYTPMSQGYSYSVAFGDVRTPNMDLSLSNNGYSDYQQKPIWKIDNWMNAQSKTICGCYTLTRSLKVVLQDYNGTVVGILDHYYTNAYIPYGTYQVYVTGVCRFSSYQYSSASSFRGNTLRVSDVVLEPEKPNPWPGIIAGSVVGGVAVLVIISLSVAYLVVRLRKRYLYNYYRLE